MEGCPRRDRPGERAVQDEAGLEKAAVEMATEQGAEVQVKCLQEEVGPFDRLRWEWESTEEAKAHA